MSLKRCEDQSVEVNDESQCNRLIMKIRKFNPRKIFTWQLAKTLAMGQGLAVFICGTAISSQYLTTNYHVNTPMLQSLLNYALLCLTYMTMLFFRRGNLISAVNYYYITRTVPLENTGDGNIFQILKRRWWKYLLLGIVDVEANYAVVKAYQYTTITSVQLLDCFILPVLMILSWWVLKTRYRLVHFVAVCICLLGVGTMVGADLLAGRDQGSSSNVLLGDGLVLLSATLYAVSNVCQEYTVKNLSRVEFLGMLGLFGTVISTVQMVILERNEVMNIKWSWEVGLLFAAFALCLYMLYSCMPIVVRLSSATSVNLSLLTADLFSLFSGLFLFQYTFSGLYLVSLVVILIGFIMYNAVPTPTAANAVGSSSSCEEERCDDLESSQNETTTQEIVLGITDQEREGEEKVCHIDEETEDVWRDKRTEEMRGQTIGEEKDYVFCSTKM